MDIYYDELLAIPVVPLVLSDWWKGEGSRRAFLSPLCLLRWETFFGEVASLSSPKNTGDSLFACDF